MNTNKVRKVGIYARLSKENAHDEESLSIENQKILLPKHICGTYSRGGKSACSSLSIGENKLHDIVLMQIREYVRIVASNNNHLAENISTSLYGAAFSDYTKRVTELKEYQSRTTMLSKLI